MFPIDLQDTGQSKGKNEGAGRNIESLFLPFSDCVLYVEGFIVAFFKIF
jgi:hypothetical protein